MKYNVYKGLLEKAFKLTESGKKWIMVKNVIDDLAEESADVKELAQKAVTAFEECEYWLDNVEILRAVEGTFRALLKSEKHEAARIDREYGFYVKIEGRDAEHCDVIMTWGEIWYYKDDELYDTNVVSAPEDVTFK